MYKYHFWSSLRHSFKYIHVSNLRKDLDLFFIRVFLAHWKDSNPDPDSWVKLQRKKIGLLLLSKEESFLNQPHLPSVFKWTENVIAPLDVFVIY